MFDGGLYALKDEIYSNNYESAYETNYDNTILLSDIPSALTGCNPYTGSGIHSAKIID